MGAPIDSHKSKKQSHFEHREKWSGGLAKDLERHDVEGQKGGNKATLSAELLHYYGGRWCSATGDAASPALIRL